MTDDTLYRRKPSGRYTPVHVPDYDGLDDGTYVVTVAAGRLRTLRQVTDEDRAALVAAAEAARRSIEAAIVERARVRPDTRATTPAERRAWAAYVAALAAEGVEPRPLALEGVSVAEVVEAGIAALVASTPAPTPEALPGSMVAPGAQARGSGGGREGGDAQKGDSNG